LSTRFVYDYVIVDEASQVDLATGALALSCAMKAIIVGDLKQLPNVVNDETKKKTDAIFGRYSLPEAYRYSNHSLLSSVNELFHEIPHVMLKEHYRCHPKIIEFCNKKFYNDQLIILTVPQSQRPPLVAYKTVEGNHARDRINLRQIDVIRDEVIPGQRLNVNDGTIGIVSPYCNHTEALQKVFGGTSVKAATVDKFQGQEKDTIILCTVDNEISEFTGNPNRLNVAVSRAVNQLILVTDGNETQKDNNIKDLINYIQYNNLEVIQSEIYSVFDYLYKSYSKKRQELLKKQKRISEYDSENLMNMLIKETLLVDSFTKCDVVSHVPLNMIIRDLHNLNDEETAYVMHYCTHVDFLIYNKLSKQPVLVIEVDGYSFHGPNTRQSQRDIMKDEIFHKYGIPIVRFKTNESGERKRLEEVLAGMVG
jgi:superfamily I DNA and/or RNA helicase